MVRRAPPSLAALALLLAGAASAEPSLHGRAVSIATLTYDDPARPLFRGLRHSTVVGEGVELDLAPEGMQNGLDVVAASVDVRDRSVVVRFAPAPPGRMAEAAFNGYVLRFEGGCAHFGGARIDRQATTLPVAEDAVRVTQDSVSVNLAGLPHEPRDVLAVELEVRDCALS